MGVEQLGMASGVDAARALEWLHKKVTLYEGLHTLGIIKSCVIALEVSFDIPHLLDGSSAMG